MKIPKVFIENNPDEILFEETESLYDKICRICGCTDYDCNQCIKKTGQPFYWVEDDVCSCCADELDIND